MNSVKAMYKGFLLNEATCDAFWARPDYGRTPGGDNLASLLSTARPHIDYIVGITDHIEI